MSGVRRSGKTVLCQSLPDVEYFDCELPSTRRLLEAPESFLRDLGPRRVVLDEIHRLPNPSELLKIAADYHPGTQVIATGSSSLGASRRFRDTLTDRKRELRLTPMLQQDEQEFGPRGSDHRFLHGGLPPFFLAAEFPQAGFQDWIDSYWARDIQEQAAANLVASNTPPLAANSNSTKRRNLPAACGRQMAFVKLRPSPHRAEKNLG